MSDLLAIVLIACCSASTVLVVLLLARHRRLCGELAMAQLEAMRWSMYARVVAAELRHRQGPHVN